MRNLVTILFISLTTFYASVAQNKGIAFLALGDSYTIGTGISKANSWPEQLTTQLRKKGVAIKSNDIIAKAGWTTTNLLNGIKEKNPNPNYDLVGLLIGVNNQYQGKGIELFYNEFPELLDKAIALAKGETKNVFVLSIPDWSVTPFARFKDKERIVKELTLYNEFIEKEVKKRGIIYIEITQISRNASVNPSLLARDSLHPSKKMYKAWVNKIKKTILR